MLQAHLESTPQFKVKSGNEVELYRILHVGEQRYALKASYVKDGGLVGLREKELADLVIEKLAELGYEPVCDYSLPVFSSLTVLQMTVLKTTFNLIEKEQEIEHS